MPLCTASMGAFEQWRQNMSRLLHFSLVLLLATYSVASGLLQIATCELSENYQAGIDHLHQQFNPIAGLLAMLLCSALFRRAQYWVQFERVLIAATTFLAAGMIVLASLDEGQIFPPASSAWQTVLRSLRDPSLTTGSYFLFVLGNWFIATAWVSGRLLASLCIDADAAAFAKATALFKSWFCAIVAPLLIDAAIVGLLTNSTAILWTATIAALTLPWVAAICRLSKPAQIGRMVCFSLISMPLALPFAFALEAPITLIFLASMHMAFGVIAASLINKSPHDTTNCFSSHLDASSSRQKGSNAGEDYDQSVCAK